MKSMKIYNKTMIAVIVTLVFAMMTACTSKKEQSGSESSLQVESGMEAAETAEETATTDGNGDQSSKETAKITDTEESTEIETLKIESEEEIEVKDGEGTAGM